jgi:hypothetical protein
VIHSSSEHYVIRARSVNMYNLMVIPRCSRNNFSVTAFHQKLIALFVNSTDHSGQEFKFHIVVYLVLKRLINKVR